MLENAQIGRSLSTRMFVIWPILQTKRLGVGGVVEDGKWKNSPFLLLCWKKMQWKWIKMGKTSLSFNIPSQHHMLKFGESCVSHLCRISRGMSAGLMLRSRDFPELKKKSIYSFICSSKPVKGLFYNQFFRGDASRVRIQLLGSHGLIFLRGTSCFLTPLPPYRPRCVGQS